MEGVRELLGGGSPNSVTAYINEWYEELGSRLIERESQISGLPGEAMSILVELWRLATRSAASVPSADRSTADAVGDAERAALVAEAQALGALNKELQQHRTTAERTLAEARALLARREAALDEARLTIADLEQSLAHARFELEVSAERLRLAPVTRPLQRQRAVRKRARRSPAPHLKRSSKPSRNSQARARPVRVRISELPTRKTRRIGRGPKRR